MSSFTKAHLGLRLALDRSQGMNVIEGFEYIVGDYKESQEIIEVLPKFYTDGISAPGRLQYPYIGFPRFGQYAPAGVLHDYLYAFGPDLGYTRKQADRIFHEALLVLGCPRLKALLGYGALRLGGQLAWRIHRLKQEAARPGKLTLCKRLMRRLSSHVQTLETNYDGTQFITTIRFNKGVALRDYNEMSP